MVVQIGVSVSVSTHDALVSRSRSILLLRLLLLRGFDKVKVAGGLWLHMWTLPLLYWRIIHTATMFNRCSRSSIYSHDIAIRSWEEPNWCLSKLLVQMLVAIALLIWPGYSWVEVAEVSLTRAVWIEIVHSLTLEASYHVRIGCSPTILRDWNCILDWFDNTLTADNDTLFRVLHINQGDVIIILILHGVLIFIQDSGGAHIWPSTTLLEQIAGSLLVSWIHKVLHLLTI